MTFRDEKWCSWSSCVGYPVQGLWTLASGDSKITAVQRCSHVMSYYIIMYHNMLFHVVLIHTSSYAVILCHIMSFQITSYFITPHHVLSHHSISYHSPLLALPLCPSDLCYAKFYCTPSISTVTYPSVNASTSRRFSLSNISPNALTHTPRPYRSWNSTLIASGDDSGRMVVAQQPCPRKPKFLTAACHVGQIAKVSSYPVCTVYTATILYRTSGTYN